MLTRVSKSNKFRRDTWVEINLENLEHNLKWIYESVKTPLMPVVKADAYGHGASMVSSVLEAYDFVWGFGVASLDEAIALRESGIEKNILILGITPPWAFETAIKNDLQMTIADLDSAIKLNEIAGNLELKAKVQLKLDTGMNRIGFKKADFKNFLRELDLLKNLDLKSLFSHFADIEDEKFSADQLSEFKELTKAVNVQKHMASSAIARKLPEAKFDMVRCGIELYGLDNPELKPLLSLFARVNFLKKIQAGDPVSYKGTWKAERESVIATLPLGYADGVPRALSNKLEGSCKGKLVKQVGNITMDQMMFDLTDIPNPKLGDVVELVGPKFPISKWAKILNTITYELVVNLNLRLAKIYTRPENDQINN